MGFTKLDERILQSSIMAESPTTFKVWIAVLAACKANGIAYVSAIYLSSVCHLSVPRVEDALTRLGSPDEHSRSLGEDGRRIRRVDGGYEVINYHAYRDAALKDAEAERKRLYRKEGPRKREGYIYFAQSIDRIKIGFSQNPWSRINEMKTANPSLALIAAIPGDMAEERDLHDRFESLNIEREWFRAEKPIFDAIDELKARSQDDAERSPDSSASASASASASGTKEKGVADFDAFWSRYPRKVAKKVAARAYASAIKAGADPEDLLRAVDGYLAHLKKNKTEERYCQHASTFLHDERWRDYLDVEPHVEVGAHKGPTKSAAYWAKVKELKAQGLSGEALTEAMAKWEGKHE